MLQKQLITISTGIGQFQTEETLEEIQEKLKKAHIEKQENPGSFVPVYFSFTWVKEEAPFWGMFYKCKETIYIDIRRTDIGSIEVLSDFIPVTKEKELEAVNEKIKEYTERKNIIEESLKDPEYMRIDKAMKKLKKEKDEWMQKQCIEKVKKEKAK